MSLKPLPPIFLVQQLLTAEDALDETKTSLLYHLFALAKFRIAEFLNLHLAAISPRH
jgi:hypothetical protein